MKNFQNYPHRLANTKQNSVKKLATVLPLLVVFASLSVSITLVQESRSERMLESLRDLARPRTLDISDGQFRKIAKKILCAVIFFWLKKVVVLKKFSRGQLA